MKTGCEVRVSTSECAALVLCLKGSIKSNHLGTLLVKQIRIAVVYGLVDLGSYVHTVGWLWLVSILESQMNYPSWVVLYAFITLEPSNVL